MVYTVTFNPAIDYVVHLDALKSACVNRSSSENVYFGGKGINVSSVLAELGVKSKALGFIAGFTGRAIADKVKEMGIAADFVELDEGCSRINVKIKAEGQETEINGQGPAVTSAAIEMLFKKLDALNDDDILVLAGSVPSSVSENIYEKVLSRLVCKKVKTVVDATKDLLLNVLKYNPFLIKPNNIELGEMFGVELNSYEEIILYAKKLRKMGAVNVLVSMAGNGAVLVDENDMVHKCGVCSGVVKNSVGAGDSMLAGFIAGYCGSGDYEYALKLGTAAGGATAFSDGLAVKEKIYELMKQL